MTEIIVACFADRSGDRWTCDVSVRDSDSTTDHVVGVDAADLPAALDRAETSDVERLVEASFEFLLEREPKESILHRFDLPVIARYFPSYPAEIGERLAARRTTEA